ncbi:MAG: glycosyltransferase family 4 protein [Chloroflexota bacterium]
MKILLAANTAWYLYNFRSALIYEIALRGWEPVLVSPPDRYAEKLAASGYRHIPWELGRQTLTPWTEYRSMQRLREIYAQEKPDLIHHHTMKVLLYGSLAVRPLGIPVVNSVPGRGYVYSSSETKAKLLKPLVTNFLRIALRKGLSQQMIFENRDDQNFFLDKRIVSEKKTTLIPSVGVDEKRFYPSPLPEGEFTVGFVGRMLREKGVELFVEAARQLRADAVSCKMVLIGEPDPGNADSVTIEELRNWDSEPNVEWWGWVEDMQEAYSRIHLLANPTNYGEGVPTTLVEAAMVNRAVVASDWPGCREIINHDETGLLVPPKDAAALARAITHMVENKADYERLRMNVHNLALKKFSAGDVNSQTLLVYENILSLDSE